MNIGRAVKTVVRATRGLFAANWPHPQDDVEEYQEAVRVIEHATTVEQEKESIDDWLQIPAVPDR